jgi:flavin reductase (DIM6/NTAB) family NADH-FMN oxidoreductase RutF
MDKVAIDSNAFLYPMPIVLVGADVNGKPNFMPVAWVTRVNYQPPLLAVAMGKPHHTNKGVRKHRELGISIPTRAMAATVDRAGLVSGARVDKSKLFGTFRGKLEHAPMAANCPVTMECRLLKTVDLPVDELFIVEIVNAYADKACLTGGLPDIRKIDPITLTMPDNRYWAVGKCAGKAWSIGKGKGKRS